jgi:hypothetical protein
MLIWTMAADMHDLAAVLKMNTILDVVEENKRITAGDAARPQETLDLVALCDAYVAEQRALERNISQKGFCEWVKKSQQQTVQRKVLRAIFKSKYKGERGHPKKSDVQFGGTFAHFDCPILCL